MTSRLRRSSVLAIALVLAACGSTRSSPDNPLSAGGLTPNVEDKEAGLVAVAPGFDLGKYKTVVVERFTVTDKLEDDGDRRFAAKMADILQLELVRRLRDSGLFQQVVSATDGESQTVTEPSLRLTGAITRLGRGSQAARAFGGLYGAGRARAQADMQLFDAGRAVVVTSDRRVSSYNPWTFGGSDDDLLEESFDDMARDFAKFLQRLSKGELPRN